MTVTFGVIAYNEHRYLPDLLEDLLKQTYSRSLIEVILVDGNSTDDTLNIMKAFQQKYKDVFLDIKVLDNPKRNQPAGWNVVLKNSTSDILLRIDAHARLPENFVEKNVECINRGEYVCGGPRENIIDENSPWKQMLLAAEQSMFGSGIASYRQDTEKKKYVKSVFHGAYRKEVVDKVGFFNEKLKRTEDNEYHYRVRKNGYKICYDPEIKSYYQTRNSLKGMVKQKYLNGYWIGKTLLCCPKCISVFHLVPFAFVLSVFFTTILAVVGIWWPLIALWGAYGIVNIGMTVGAFRQNFRFVYVAIPMVFLLLHVNYGVGTALGIIAAIPESLYAKIGENRG